MATFNKIPLSNSTNGKSILVSASASVGTTLHTAVSSTEFFDEIWIYAINTSASASKLTVEYGGTADKDDIELTISPENGLILIVPGLFLNNSQVISAFSSIPNTIAIHGYAHRVST